MRKKDEELKKASLKYAEMEKKFTEMEQLKNREKAVV
jgi:hypothetical protein